MGKTTVTKSIEVPERFTDVLFLTNRGQIPFEIKRLFRQKKLSYLVLPIEKYEQVQPRLDLIGTVVVDPEGLGPAAQQQLARVIESLELQNIGIITLTGRVRVPIRSFSLAPAHTSFSMADTVESFSIDDLWGRISINLACRKKGLGIVARPTLPSRPLYSGGKNRLLEQLRITEALVDNLAEQLRLAGLVQQDFLPTRFPQTDKLRWACVFQPAEWVSGDIYDVVRVDEHHVGFYVADVVGHGMPAALLTIFLKQALVMRETTANGYYIFPPAEVMKNLNVRMAAQKLSGYQFATCCYFLLNTETLQARFSRAGHPYPILIRPGQEPQQLQLKGSLLGIFDKAEYFEQTVQLQPADKLIVYSDGAEPFFGGYDDQSDFHFADRFIELTDRPVSEIMKALNDFVKQLLTDSAEVDDVTAVALEVL